MRDFELLYVEKREDFSRVVNIIKFETAIGKMLRSAHYRYEIKKRADDPSKEFVNEWLEIKANGYEYKINVCANSQLANEKQLFAVLCFEEGICGLISKEGY